MSGRPPIVDEINLGNQELYFSGNEFDRGVSQRDAVIPPNSVGLILVG
jgi:hypothetical protein